MDPTALHSALASAKFRRLNCEADFLHLTNGPIEDALIPSLQHSPLIARPPFLHLQF
jgi:hypothetical protein